MPAVALIVKMVAKPDTADELSQFLAGAVEMANAEAGTPIWFALQTDDVTCWIVDAFPSEAERQTHLEGPIAAALMANADRLLACAPEILRANVLAEKITV